MANIIPFDIDRAYEVAVFERRVEAVQEVKEDWDDSQGVPYMYGKDAHWSAAQYLEEAYINGVPDDCLRMGVPGQTPELWSGVAYVMSTKWDDWAGITYHLGKAAAWEMAEILDWHVDCFMSHLTPRKPTDPREWELVKDLWKDLEWK